MHKQIRVDTRELEAPEPMGVVLNQLYLLDENTSIVMIHRIEPQMLFVHLDKNDINYKVTYKSEDVYIYIWNQTFKHISKIEEE